MKNIGEVLAAFRKKAGYTQLEAADELTRLGYPVQNKTIYAWEKNKSTPNPVQFLLLCKLYGITDIYSSFIEPNPSNPFSSLNEAGIEKALDFIRILGLTDEYGTDSDAFRTNAEAFRTHEATTVSISSAAGKGRKKAVSSASEKDSSLPQSDSVYHFPTERELPLYQLAASAGTGEFLDNDKYEMIIVGSEVPEKASFGIRLNGNSMEPRYMNGQIVWVYRTTDLFDGDIGIFYLDGQAYCKKLHKVNGHIELLSFNPAYKPIPVTESSEFKIFGRVIS